MARICKDNNEQTTIHGARVRRTKLKRSATLLRAHQNCALFFCTYLAQPDTKAKRLEIPNPDEMDTWNPKFLEARSKNEVQAPEGYTQPALPESAHLSPLPDLRDVVVNSSKEQVLQASGKYKPSWSEAGRQAFTKSRLWLLWLATFFTPNPKLP